MSPSFSMNITVGLFDNMVVQRDHLLYATVRLRGSCHLNGCLLATVRKNRKPLAEFTRIAIGKSRRGVLTGILKKLPVGGPYDIELTLVNEAEETLNTKVVHNVLVGDVWMLGGQSNMAGCGNLEPRQHLLAPNKQVRAFYQDDHWDVAQDPLHLPETAKAEAHARIGYAWRRPEIGAGLGVAFGQKMLSLTDGVPQGLIASAHGATSLAQWSPQKKREGTRSLYGAMLDRLRKNGGKCAGLVWYQGCSETNPQDAPLYTSRMIEFIHAVRRDFGNPRLPVVLVQLGRFTAQKTATEIPCWNSIREQQRLLPVRVDYLRTVPAIDLEQDDAIHLGATGLITLGYRLAEAMSSLSRGRMAASLRPIELDSVKFIPETSAISISFKHVRGSLRAAGRPTGFSVREGVVAVPSIIRTELQGSTVILKTSLPSYLPLQGKALYHGFGLDPYTNIEDQGGRPLPTLGPIELVGRPPQTCFFPDIEVTPPLLWPGSLDAVTYPKNEHTDFVPSLFRDFYCAPPSVMTRKPGSDELHYFRFRFTCAVRMPLRLLFGYDGPVKVFIDKQACFADPAGTNPITIDEAKIDFAADKGEHEVMIALGTNQGKAWGVCARLDRSDLGRMNRSQPVVYPEILATSSRHAAKANLKQKPNTL